MLSLVVTCTYSKLIGEQKMITAGQAYNYKKNIAIEKLDMAIKRSAESGYTYLTLINYTEVSEHPDVLSDKSVYKSMYEDDIKSLLENLGYKVETDYDANYVVSWKEE